jgi:signal peptidase complex subunit 3
MRRNKCEKYANGGMRWDSARGRPHYYSKKEEQYAVIRFSLDADLSSLFTWNTKQVFVYVTAVWPSTNASHGSGDLEAGVGQAVNEAVIWDTIIMSPSSDHLSNLAPAAKKKLVKSGKGKSIDPSRFVFPVPTTWNLLRGSSGRGMC